MPTIEQFAANAPVMADLSAQHQQSSAMFLQALQEQERRRQQQAALNSPLIQGMIQQLSDPPGSPTAPGLFGLDTAGFQRAYPAMAQTIGLQAPAPGSAQPGPASPPVPAIGAPASGGPSDVEQLLAGMGYAPEDSRPWAKQVVDFRAGRIPLEQVAPPLRGIAQAGVQQPAVAPQAPALASASMLSAPSAPSASPMSLEQFELYRQLAPLLSQRFASDERLQASLASAEQRHSAAQLNGLVRSLGIAQADIASLRRLQAESLRLASRPKQSGQDLRDRLRLAQMRVTLANAAAQRYAQMMQSGMDAALPGTPAAQMMEQTKRELDEMLLGAQEDIQEIGQIVRPQVGITRAPPRAPGAPSAQPVPQAKVPTREEALAEGVTLADLVAAGMSEPEAKTFLAGGAQ